MPRPRPPFLHRERSRHGKVVWVVRRAHGERTRIRAEYDTDDFWEEYRAALSGKPRRPAAPKANSLAWAIDRYRHSSDWAALAMATRKQRENIYKAVTDSAGQEPLANVDAAAIRDGRERRSATPHGANNFLKAVRGFFKWATQEGLVKTDPTLGITLLRGANDRVGFHTWTEEELGLFERTWPLGTRERLAFDILLYTGLRRGDAVKLGRQHIRDGVISFRKTEKTGEDVTLPLLPPLAASIAAARTGDLTFLVTERGLPFIKEGFGNWFGEVCRKTGCPGSAHGLRKSGATRAANNGATTRQLMALYGWRDPKMAERYTRTADRARLAASAAKLLVSAQTENEERPHQGLGEGDKAETAKRSGG